MALSLIVLNSLYLLHSGCLVPSAVKIFTEEMDPYKQLSPLPPICNINLVLPFY